MRADQAVAGNFFEHQQTRRMTTMALPILDPNAPPAPEFTRRYVNLADPRLGAQALEASDDFFAPRERMLNPEPAVFIPGKHDDHGKWTDGWDAPPKRTSGDHFCVGQLQPPAGVQARNRST